MIQLRCGKFLVDVNLNFSNEENEMRKQEISLNERVRERVIQAMRNFDIAKKAKTERETKILSEKVWEVGADFEYILFIIRLSGENADNLEKENIRTSRNTDVNQVFSNIQNLLKEALAVDSSDLKGVYKKIWSTQIHILRTQKALERATIL